MDKDKSVFEKTYEDYLGAIGRIDFEPVAPVLNITLEGDMAFIPFFGKAHTVSSRGMANPTGKRPSHDICVILSKYLLMCPSSVPVEESLVSFRDFRDSAPLLSYFANDVERAVATHFSRRRSALETACSRLSARGADLDADYDIAVRMDALPRVPVILLFNDADDEFPAGCSILFEKRAELFLDAECLAMLGRQVYEHLRAVEQP